MHIVLPVFENEDVEFSAKQQIAMRKSVRIFSLISAVNVEN